jgi:transcriptional regulator with XRE-family HTH domain
MLDSNKVKASEAGKTRLREAMRQAKLTQEELADQANTSVDTIKRLLETKPAPNGIEKWAVKNIAWMQDKNIVDETFIEQVAAKSENNFMYLRYVLPDISKCVYQDLTLEQLPDEEYETPTDVSKAVGAIE